MPPPKRPLKPHIRRQIRQTALLANPIRDPSQDFSITGYEADLIKGRKTEEVLMREKEGMVEWDGVKPLGMEGQIRVDRHDILNLIKSIPDLTIGSSSHSRPASSRRSSNIASTSTSMFVSILNQNPPSPTLSAGWSSLSSSHEDNFFFSGSEGEEFDREKKRRKWETGREDRLRMMEEQRGMGEASGSGGGLIDGEEANSSVHGRVNEHDPEIEETEPSPPTLQTMTHTLTSILASLNPQVLELRILTHHGTDPRFSFLRKGGKWNDFWEGMKKEKTSGGKGKEKEKEKQAKPGIGGLMGAYADSDSDSDGEADDEREKDMDKDILEPGDQPPPPPAEENLAPEPPEDVLPPLPQNPPLPEENGTTISDQSLLDAQAARRAKAKEWARQRQLKAEATS